jgi:hypothetical protein
LAGTGAVKGGGAGGGFKPQRASSFMKRVKVPEILVEAARALTVITLFVLPYTLLVVSASSNSGDL